MTNILKIYKNVVYKITPLGILFPASLTNDTTQIFVFGKNLSGVKQAILNNKLFDILGVVDLNKQLERNQRSITLDKCTF